MAELNPLYKEIADNLGLRRSAQESTTTQTEVLSNVECETCQDRGYVVGESHRNYYCPDCGLQNRYDNLLRISGIIDIMTFEEYKGDEKWQNLARLDCYQLIECLSPINLILLYGDRGTGKTHLATAACMEWIEQGKACKFVRCMDWLKKQKSAIKDNKADEVFQELADIPLLAIDELDYYTEYDKHTMNDLICTRVAKQYPTIITTNKDYLEVDRDLGRVTSRAMDTRHGRTIPCVGEDYRRKL